MPALKEITLNFDDGSVQRFATTPVSAPPPPPPDPTPAPAPSGIVKGGFFDGIADNLIPDIASQFGMNYIRLWHGVRDWNLPPAANHPTFIRARALKAAGMKVLVVVTPIEKGSNPASVPPLPTDTITVFDYFSRFADAANGCIDAVEVLNEPNLENYLSSYNKLADTIKFIQLPAYKALSGAGLYVVAGGPQERAYDQWTYMIRKGLLDCGDSIAYHPYGPDAAAQLTRVQAVYNLLNGKPMWVTEFGLHVSGSNTFWASELVRAATLIKPYVAAVFQFRMLRTTQAAGRAAPFYDDGGSIIQDAVFHDKILEAMRIF